MIHLVVGMPGPFTDWCARALAGLLRRQGIEADLAGVGRLERAGWVALTGDARDTVCYAIAMDEALARAVAAAARGPVLAHVEPRAAMASCLAQRGLAPVEGFRIVLTAAVAIGQAGAHPGALRLTLPDCAEDPVGALRRLGARLGADPGPEVAAAEAAALRPLLRAACSASDDIEPALAARLGEPRFARAMCDMLDEYAAAAAGRLAKVSASADLFLSGAAPHGPLRGPVDVTGAARFLFVGGHLPLPVGAWEAEILLDVSESATEGVYVVDLVMHRQGQASVLAHNQLTLAAPGRHRMTLAFQLRATDALVETRLRSERAMFDGTIELLGVRFRRRDLTRSDAAA